MKKSKLRKEFLKSGKNKDRKKNTKQRNICVLLLRIAKKRQYRSFNENIFTYEDERA